MNRIENIAQLRMEIARLKLLQAEQETLIKNDIQEIKKSLQPINIAKRYISNMFSKNDKDHDLITKGAGMGASFLSQKILLKNAPFLVRKAVSFILENLTTNVVADKQHSLIDKIKGFFRSEKGSVNPI